MLNVTLLWLLCPPQKTQLVASRIFTVLCPPCNAQPLNLLLVTTTSMTVLSTTSMTVLSKPPWYLTRLKYCNFLVMMLSLSQFSLMFGFHSMPSFLPSSSMGFFQIFYLISNCEMVHDSYLYVPTGKMHAQRILTLVRNYV